MNQPDITLDQRFSGLGATPAGGKGEALVFEVRPAKVLAFAKGRFGQTRHSFR